MTDKISIEIDGKTYEAEPGQMVIEVADQNGIDIPRFCYHKKLSVAANCRMCLVEVEKAPKELPACATPVTAGMKVFTQSHKAIAAQKAVMEFLLINHPLDCPICDQGGECELQDVSMGYGEDLSHYHENKRVVDDENIGPLISTDMTRCIQCTRCVRFGDEVAGLRELGATGRGENMQIGTYIKHSLVSEVSGNIIDLCPVGALTSKPFRYTARAWELLQTPAVAPHDCLGSNIYVHSRRQAVMRVVPRDNEGINETWISDRDRFSYVAVNSEQRLLKPRIKRHNVWEEVEWQEALNHTVTRLRRIIEDHGAKQIAALASPSSTLEEFFLLQKLMRGIGCPNVDYRVHQTDTRDQNVLPQFPKFELPIASIEDQNAILLIGLNAQRDIPLLGVRLRKASLLGAHIMAINCVDHTVNFDFKEKLIADPNQMVLHVAGVAKALLATSSYHVPEDAKKLLEHINPTAEQQAIAKQLQQASKKSIVVGLLAMHHPEASTIRSLSRLIARLLDCEYCELTDGANSAGAWIAGFVPHRDTAGKLSQEVGLSAYESLKQELKAYVLLNLELEHDSANAKQALNALKKAEFVVALTPFINQHLLEHADVLLPVTPFTETSGTYVNAEGTWQNFTAAVRPLADSKPAWKVFRVLGNLFELNDFEYQTSEEVAAVVKAQMLKEPFPQQTMWYVPKSLPEQKTNASIQRITEWAIYGVDSLVRRSQPLQQCATQERACVKINPQLAQELNIKDETIVTVKQGEQTLRLTAVVTPHVPNHCALIYAGLPETSGFGATFGEIEIVGN